MTFQIHDRGPDKCQLVKVTLQGDDLVEYLENGHVFDLHIDVPADISHQLKPGAVFVVNMPRYRNHEVIGMWTGTELVKLDYETITDYGFIPPHPAFDILSMDVPITYWYKNESIMYIDDYVWIDASKVDKFKNNKGESMIRFTCGGKTYKVSEDVLDDVDGTNLKTLHILPLL